MKRYLLVTSIGVVVSLGFLADRADAQYKPQSRPFDTQSRRPSVSPYMNLVNNSMSGASTNYQSLVRPQVDQQNFNSHSASAIKNLQRTASSPARSKATTEGGNTKMRVTGHAATRQNYSHFYPTLGR
ncbi:MAG TPA: hypothetical protein VGG64_24370 [Pirellulales bacterium]|jgi:hypothetical protein